MSGAILPLPQYDFMEWCSVKKSTGTTLLYFTLLYFTLLYKGVFHEQKHLKLHLNDWNYCSNLII
jgi:hypothetical protein